MIFFAILLAAQAAAAPLIFAEGSFYPVKADWKDPVPGLRFLSDGHYDSTINFVSFDAGSDKPSFTNQTQQRLRWKSLPAVAGEDKFELLFEDYRSRSKVQLFPGMQPMETSLDFGVYLSSRALKLSGKNGKPQRIDNVEMVRKEVGAEFRDPGARQAFLLTFQEKILLDGTRSFLQEESCLQGASQKDLGASWTISLQAQDSKTTSECKFDGWADVKGQRVMVISVVMPKVSQVTKLPMGKTATVDTEGKGRIYFHPKTKESLSELEITITQVGESGQVPRGYSTMKSSAHAAAL